MTRYYRIFMVILVVSLIVGCQKKDDQGKQDSLAIKVGYLPVSTTLPNWLAKTEGLASNANINIKFKRYANSNLLLMALINGEIQATSVCADEPILAAASKKKSGFEIYLQEILTIDRVFDAVIVKDDSSILTLADLKGKTIACFPGTQLKAYLEIILQKAGLNPSAVKIVQLPPSNMLPSLEGETVDACFALEPIITIGKTKKLTRTVVASPIAKYIGDGKPIPAASFLISTGWADKHPKAADAFVQSVYDAVNLIVSDYPTAAKRYPEFTPIPSEIAPMITITEFATIENFDRTGIEKEIAVLREAGVVTGSIDIEKLIFKWRDKTE